MEANFFFFETKGKIFMEANFLRSLTMTEPAVICSGESNHELPCILN